MGLPKNILDIQAFNKKELSAYSCVFKSYYPALCDFAGRIIGSEAAPDLVDDLFLKIWGGNVQFNDVDHLKAYLFRSIKNASLDFIKLNKRAQDRNAFFTEEYLINESDYLAGIIRAEVIMELYAAIADLPTEKGRIIKMTFLEGKTNQETADELGLSIQTVKNQKLRGLALLRKKMPGNAYAFLLLYPFFFT